MGVILHPMMYNMKFLRHQHTSVQTLRLNNDGASIHPSSNTLYRHLCNSPLSFVCRNAHKCENQYIQ